MVQYKTHCNAFYIDIFHILRIVLRIMQAGDYLLLVAERVKRERLARNIPQREMAHRVDLSLRAYQMFEATGQIALDKLVKILFVFGNQNDLLSVLPEKSGYRSLDDFEQKHQTRQRARLSRKRP